MKYTLKVYTIGSKTGTKTYEGRFEGAKKEAEKIIKRLGRASSVYIYQNGVTIGHMATSAGTGKVFFEASAYRPYDVHKHPKYLITGTDRAGKRFRISTDTPQHYNIWQGTLWSVDPSTGKKKKVMSYYN